MIQSALHSRRALEQEIVQDFAVSSHSIIKALTYFDIFHYPLTSGEIKQFLDRKVDEESFRQSIATLQDDEKIFFHGGFYSVQNNPLLAIRRKQGNQYAEALLLKAVKVGRFLHQFPFVRAVGVSGSLSKNFADEKADIDFFIIAKADRLWIARTFMHLYKKFTFLTGKQHLYCMNYYVDQKALLLKEQNIFTAMEIKTLLPISGKKDIQLFFGVNKWADELLPACDFRIQQKDDPGKSLIKKSVEWMLNGWMGNHLENFLFRLTQKRWKRKMEKGKRNQKGQTMGLITDKHSAKSNPGDFQEKVLAMYEQKLRQVPGS